MQLSPFMKNDLFNQHTNFSYMKRWIQVGMHQVHLEGWRQMKITLIKLNKTNDKKKIQFMYMVLLS